PSISFARPSDSPWAALQGGVPDSERFGALVKHRKHLPLETPAVVRAAREQVENAIVAGVRDAAEFDRTVLDQQKEGMGVPDTPRLPQPRVSLPNGRHFAVARAVDFFGRHIKRIHGPATPLLVPSRDGPAATAPDGEPRLGGGLVPMTSAVNAS